MATNIRINNKAHTLEVSKKFYNASTKYGSPEFEELKEARADFPKYRVVTKQRKMSNPRITPSYDVMEKYLTKHKPESLRDFFVLTGQLDDDDCIKEVRSREKSSYMEVRDWFLNLCPEIEESANSMKKEQKKILNQRIYYTLDNEKIA